MSQEGWAERVKREELREEEAVLEEARRVWRIKQGAKRRREDMAWEKEKAVLEETWRRAKEGREARWAEEEWVRRKAEEMERSREEARQRMEEARQRRIKAGTEDKKAKKREEEEEKAAKRWAFEVAAARGWVGEAEAERRRKEEDFEPPVEEGEEGEAAGAGVWPRFGPDTMLAEQQPLQ